MKTKNNPLFYISEFVDGILNDLSKIDNSRCHLHSFTTDDPSSDSIEEDMPSPSSPNFVRPGSPGYGFFSSLSKTPKYVSPPFKGRLELNISDRFDQLEKDVMETLLCSHQIYYEEFKSLALMVSHLTSTNEKQKIFGLIDQAKKNISIDSVNTANQDENDGSEFQSSLKKWKNDIIQEDKTLQTYDSFQSLSSQFHDDNQKFLKKILELYVYQLLFEKAYISYLNLPQDKVFQKLFDQGFALYVGMQLKKDMVITDVLSGLGNNKPIAVAYGNDYARYCQGISGNIQQAMMEQPTMHNAKRLALGRVRRFYLSLNALSNDTSSNWIMNCWEPVFRVVMGWLNFIFFLPRIFLSICELISHTFLLGEHTEEEKNISLETRFLMHFSRRWEILARDFAWMMNGFLSLFVLIGVLAVWSLFVNAFVQLLEVFLNIYLLARFEEQQTEILSYFEEESEIFGEDKTQDFMEDLSSRMQLEYEFRFVRLINSILILIGSMMILPTMALVSPIIPLIGAILALSVTMFNFIYLPDWEKRRLQKLEPLLLSREELLHYSPSKKESLDFINIFTTVRSFNSQISNVHNYIP